MHGIAGFCTIGGHDLLQPSGHRRCDGHAVGAELSSGQQLMSYLLRLRTISASVPAATTFTSMFET